MFFPLEKRKSLMLYCMNNPPASLVGSRLLEVKTFDGVKYVADDGSWLMLRGSGTEPILRIYAESNSEKKAKALINLGVKLTKSL